MRRLVTGTGSYLPERRVTNAELEEHVHDFDPRVAGKDLDGWILDHFGIRARHWAADDESTGDMALSAARRALEDARVAPGEVDLIVLATATSDFVAPHSVSHVQAELGCEAVFHQLQDACPGFLNALMVADSLMANLGYRTALVIAAEKMTHLIDRGAFRMSGLFADGAGAVVLQTRDDEAESFGFQAFYAGSDGRAGMALRVPAGGTRRPLTAKRLEAGEHLLVNEFDAVYPFAVRTTERCIREILERTGLEPGDITWLIPHHASHKIIESGAGQAGIRPEQVWMTLDEAGNTSSASVPIALDALRRSGKLADGDRLLLLALGGGMGWGATLYVWREPRA